MVQSGDNVNANMLGVKNLIFEGLLQIFFVYSNLHYKETRVI